MCVVVVVAVIVVVVVVVVVVAFPASRPKAPQGILKGPPKGPPRSSQGILGSSFSCNVLWVNVLLGALFPLFEFAKLIVSSLRECTFLRSPVRLEGSSR